MMRTYTLDADSDDVSALVSFGVDPTDVNNRGVGVYSMPLCLADADVEDTDNDGETDALLLSGSNCRSNPDPDGTAGVDYSDTYLAS